MKKGLIIALLALSCAFAEAQERIHWLSFDEAVAACQKNPKKIFIDVYTDWCGWCKRMDKDTFQNPVIVKYINKEFYAVKLDAESNDTIRFKGHMFCGSTRPDGRKGSHQLAQALLQGKMSYPSYVIMNEEAMVLQVIGGYQEPKHFEPLIHFFGDDAYKIMSGDEFLKQFKSALE